MKGQFTRKQADLIIRSTDKDWVKYIEQYVIHRQRRMPHLEPYIAQFPEAAYIYARSVIRGRWPEAEPVIAKHPRYAVYYARRIIQDRWPEAEPVIAEGDWYWEYNRYITQGW